MPKDLKTTILDTDDDLVSMFLYYDRKEDEDLSRFRECLEKGLQK